MNMKKKLVAATAMMLISALMLTSVSFAWVTLSTNPEVKGITATAAANGNLEIALNDSLDMSVPVNDQNLISPTDGSLKNNMYVYGNLVEFNGTDAILDSVELRQAVFANKDTNGPVTNGTSGNSFLKTYTYGADGRKDTLTVLTDGVYSTTPKKQGYSMVTGTLNSVTKNYAVRFDYWLRTNENGNLTLCDATERDSAQNGQATWTGEGSYIEIPSTLRTSDNKTPVKVAFVITDYGTDGTSAGTTTVISDGITYTETASGSNKFKLEGTLLSTMTADFHYLVQMYVYLDGNMVTNAMLNDVNSDEIKVNVQFDNSSIDNPMQ